MKNPLQTFFMSWSTWSALGYEITLIHLFGKEGIRCSKKVEGRVVVCEQIYEHNKLPEEFDRVVNFMTENIQKQLTTGEYYEPYS